MNKFMRLLVYFDIPVKTTSDRKAAAKFRKFLLDDGYNMIQFSVYSRVCCGIDAVYKHKSRLKSNIPEHGYIIAFFMTEKEYEKREILLQTEEKKDYDYPCNLLDLF